MSYPNPNPNPTYNYTAPPPSSYNQPPPPGPPYGAPPQPAPYGSSQPGPNPPYGSSQPGPNTPYGSSQPGPNTPYGSSQPGPNTPYGAPPQPGSTPPYGTPPQPGSTPSYGAPQPGPSAPPPGSHSSTPYGAPPQPGPYGSSQPGPNQQYGAPAPSAPPYSSDPYKPPSYGGQQAYGGGGGYGAQMSPYGAPAPTPSSFPPGTDPNLIACFQMADRDGSGFIDDKELQTALSSYNQSFSIRTVHLLMNNFTNSNARKIGPREFTSVFYSLQNWRSIFERFDRDRSGKIDAAELREALLSLGFSVSPGVLDLLISKFTKSGGMVKGIEYDNFIECCITVKGLTEKFKEKDTSYTGSASFTYEAFMLTVLPFLIA